MAERYELLDWAERWINDAFDIVPMPGGCCLVEVDMTRSALTIGRLRAGGIRATPTHLFIRAVSLALTRHPELNQMVLGGRRVVYDQVSVSLSVAGEAAMAPMMMIENAGAKSLPEIAAEVIRSAAHVREADTKSLAMLRRWGWLFPASFLRRAALRWLRRRDWYRRARLGTIQITSVPGLDVVVPFTFGTSAIIGIGRVKPRVVARDGQPVVCSTANIVCSFNHKVWDGMRVQAFLTEVARILESGELDREIADQAAAAAGQASYSS